MFSPIYIYVSFSERIHIDTVIEHFLDFDNDDPARYTSLAEGHPGKLRVVMPDFLAFTADDQADVATNYTGVVSNYFLPENAASSDIFNTFDLVFESGVTFADVIAFSFSLTVDPVARRSEGSPDAEGVVSLAMVCTQNEYDSFPVAPDLDRPCGETVHLTVRVTTAGGGAKFMPLIYIGNVTSIFSIILV